MIYNNFYPKDKMIGVAEPQPSIFVPYFDLTLMNVYRNMEIK